jgi:hypothetical protein
MLLSRRRDGDAARAAKLLEEARALCEEFRIPALLDRLPSAEAVFRREGDVWTIAYGQSTFRLRDSKGLRYLAFLLGSPATEVHVLELARAAAGTADERTRRSSFTTEEPVLDATAKEVYRRRLEDLGQELQQARDWGDLERAAQIQAEVDAVTEELARAAGLGGRDRTLPSPTERARVSVTKAIRAAIKAIGRQSPELATHLSASVHTGRFCSYAPPGEAPPRWTL